LLFTSIRIRGRCRVYRFQSNFIFKQAIRDGVIDANIDHTFGTLVSNELVDIYSTNEPMVAFNQRTRFCLDLYNESIKAMRYPLNPKQKPEEIEQPILRDLDYMDMDDEMDDF
jgi:26S proteasome regulatory subunit N3